MKIRIISLLILVSMASVHTQSQKKVPAIPRDNRIEQKVDSVLKQMTLDEKIGQMTQLALDVLGKGANIYATETPFQFDEKMLQEVIREYKVGSILNTATGVPMTAQQWTDIVTRIQQEAIDETGIPIIYGVDQNHGVTYTIDGTFFPQSIGMAATFNPRLVELGTQVTAYESRACNVPWAFSTTLDMGRDARWARIWENYGEDTYVSSMMGKASVLGFQGANPNMVTGNFIATCLKHYVGYGDMRSGKDRTPSYIPDNELRERHFQPFLDAIQAGALSVMVNSGLINGLPVHANKTLLTEWLKEDLNWDGVIVTDWADINKMYDRDRIVASKKDAIELAINAGIDMAMVPYEVSFCTDLKELIGEGRVSMARVDDAVKRVLRMKFRLGLFERPYWKLSEYPDFASDKHAQIALNAAEESITLLKNEKSILPLAKNAKILIAGPNANNMRSLNGGWTLSWQGEKADIYTEKYNTIVEAFVNKLGVKNVVYEAGVTYKTTANSKYYEENEPEIEKAVEAAQDVDYILLALGENSYCETPGNLDDLTLSANQLKLAEALAATGKPVILILNEGRPRVISSIEPLMKAVVQTYLPGNYGGDALANIVCGDVNPSGKLPYTYPKYVNSLTTYDHKPSESIDKMAGAYDYDAVVSIQWAFGYGLSYTTFSYGDITVNKTKFVADDILTFTVDVTNTGSRDGKETVMLYSSDKIASLTPDVRRLRAFEKIELNAGETKTVTLQLKASDLAFVHLDGKWILEKGDFGIQIGSKTIDVLCTETKKWTTPNR